MTLLTSPIRPSLDASLVTGLRDAWDGGSILWLAPAEAAEFYLPERPGNLWQVWDDLQRRGVDWRCSRSPGGASGCCWPTWIRP